MSLKSLTIAFYFCVMIHVEILWCLPWKASSQRQYTSLRGSSYTDLPAKIKNKQCCINVQNNDNKYFVWAVLSALHPVDEKYHPDRVSKYEQYKNELKFDDISFPVKLDKINKFEKLN